MNAAVLLWGLVFGSVGLGFVSYGRRQRATVPLVCGLALMVLPYLVPNAWLMVALGTALALVPYFVRH